jgi:hypothetical protein
MKKVEIRKKNTARTTLTDVRTEQTLYHPLPITESPEDGRSERNRNKILSEECIMCTLQ